MSIPCHVRSLFFIGVAIAMALLIATAFFHDDEIGARDLLGSAWGRLAVVDAYFAIFTVYLLTAVRETTWRLRALWLFLYLGLGSLAIAVYMLFRFERRARTRVRS
jgi:hypothetical protein